ncbi:MAG TPA: DNA-directed RNA polymerase subunit omega [Bacteroidetes bacterium]|uniref:DNA-directed RNA polymerase subunit omega n=1 Tax=candidate division TA06 bacterium TaxID=2250710 RepID=A0A660S672_UNCT6|nr:MAG: DNA-directed RNA polymerase subunit omega [candidate division TA06 bacterium]HHD83145.1 DNA-directed RNA polymerase subunit omega [Bacteroidota bacterium]
MKKEFFSIEEIWKRYPNKYLAVILTAKKARKINQEYVDALKMEEAIGEILDRPKEKPTILALKDILENPIKIEEDV